MPIKPSQIRDILDAKRNDFTAFNQQAMTVLRQYRQAMKDLCQWSAADVKAKFTDLPESFGAMPLESLAQANDGVIPCNLTWQSREQSLAWVRERLMGIKTFAVDGSQIYPGKDLSIPVALVQVGWFENPHLPSGGYDKDVMLDVMTPVDLQAGNSGDPVDRRVNMRRFQMEIQRLVQYIEEHPGCQDCLVFMDGSLIATFAEAFDPQSRQFYVDCLLDLLRASEQHRVPLVAYIDTTYAQDMAEMLRLLFNLPESDSIHDAQLLNPFMEWGDRTPIAQCRRHGILGQYEDYAHRLGFTYLKTTRDSYPARLEFPLWMWEAGLMDRVIGWVRGEVIIGSGYPYVIETADQTAVLQVDDRQAFFRILQDWAEQEDLNLRFSRKMVSKVRRR